MVHLNHLVLNLRGGLLGEGGCLLPGWLHACVVEAELGVQVALHVEVLRLVGLFVAQEVAVVAV